MKQKTLKKLQKQVDAFNEKYPMGSTVMLDKGGEVVHVKVKFPAQVLYQHSAVGWFEGISGCYSLDMITEL